MSHIWTGFALALSIQLALHASQSQPSTQQPANPTVSSATVTVTGCLQPGTGAATGSPTAPDAPTPSPGAAHFVLAQPATTSGASDSPAAAVPTGSGGVAAPAGAAGTSGSTVRVSRYILHGRDGELAKHVGQRVEIIGTSSQAPPADTTAAAAAGAATQVIPHEPQRGTISTLPAGRENPEATAHPSVQHLTVQSVRTLAATCP